MSYFEALGQTAHVWAVDPVTEGTWPADEHAWIGGKIIGFQLKRPELGPPPQGHLRPEFSRLFWDCGNRAKFEFIRDQDERVIWYVLPTFTNRRLRKAALHHCIFWTPKPKEEPGTRWYTTPTVQRRGRPRQDHPTIERHPISYRWGNFLEMVQQCSFGHVVEEGEQAGGYISEIKEQLKNAGYFAERKGEKAKIKEALVFAHIGWKPGNVSK